MTYLQQLNAIQAVLQDHDHFDVKTIDSTVTLREFLVGALTYYPTWIKALYGIRWGFVRLLGMKQETMPIPQLTPDTMPFEAGNWATFFQVYQADENLFWIASATDKHLDAYLAIAVEQLSDGNRRFHVGTIVHYNNWAGPIYFNVIRPFHHIVVSHMMKAGAQYVANQYEVQHA